MVESSVRKIKAEMVLKGITQVQIAQKIKVSPITVSVVIGGYGKSQRIRRAIASALGKRVEELWPRCRNKFGTTEIKRQHRRKR